MEPNITEPRVCGTCLEIKPYTIEFWPASRGRALGAMCRLCARSYKRDFDRTRKQKRVAARTQSVATLVEQPALPASKRGAVSLSEKRLPGELPLRQLEIANALRVGAARLNESAQGILETILDYAANTQSPHHEWALRLLVERVLPKKLYEDLGSQAAGIKAGTGTIRPSVTIIVQPAAGPAPAEPFVKTIEGERLS